MDEELAKMVVKVEGDLTNYRDTLEEAEGLTREFGATLAGIGAGLTAGITAPLVAFANMAVDEFINAENASLRLTAAIEGGGHAATNLTKQYTEMANELQSVTKYEDDFILGLFQEAESMGVSGDAAKKAVKEALALASAKGISAQSTIRMTIALAEGRAEMLQRYIPALKGIKDPTEKAEEAHKRLADMFGVAEADSKTFSGQLEILQRDFGNALEPIGKMVAEGIVPLLNYGKQLIQWFDNLSPTAKTAAATTAAFAAAIGPLLIGLGGLSLSLGATIALYKMYIAQNISAIASTGLWVIGIAAVTAAFIALEVALAEVNRRQEEGRALQKAIADEQQDRLSKDLAEAARGGDDQKRQFILGALDEEAQKVKAYEMQLQQLRNNVRQMEAENNERSLLGAWLFGKTGNKELAEGQVKNVEIMLNAANARAKQLKDALEDVGGPAGKGPSEKDIKSFEKFNQHLDAQIQAFGQISQAARLAEYATKGFTQAEIEAAEAKVARLESLKENAKEEKKTLSSATSLEASIRSLSESLKTQIEGFDESTGKMSSHELAVSKAQSKLDELMKTVEGGSEAYEILDKAQGELNKAMGDAKNLAAMEKQQKLLKKGEEFTKKHGEAQDRFNEKKKDLDELLEANVISIQTYNKALQEAAELANKEYNAKFKVETSGIEALKSGSAEAEAHIQSFLQNKQGLSLDMKPPSTTKANKLTNADGEMKVDMATTNDLLGAIKEYIVDRSITLLSIQNAGLL